MNNNLINYNNLYLLRPFGLYNSHILCYFNSLLQSLFSCTSLTEYILNNEKKFEEHNFMKLYIIILKKYILLDKETFDHQLVESSNILMFNEFLILIKNKNIKFGFTQEDSGELLVLLLDIINDNYIYNLFYNKYKCDIYCKNCKNCKNIKDDISIQFEIDSNNITSKYLKSIVDKDLHDFNKYIRNNYSEFDNYKCENCNQINNCIKINRLTLAPTILVINFNKYVEKKNYIFPAELFFINQPNNKKYNYRLISTINHSGNTNSGHYISKNIRKTLTIDNNNLKIINQIYKMNDSSYNIDTLKPESDTYIIFYHYIDSTNYYI